MFTIYIFQKNVRNLNVIHRSTLLLDSMQNSCTPRNFLCGFVIFFGGKKEYPWSFLSVNALNVQKKVWTFQLNIKYNFCAEDETFKDAEATTWIGIHIPVSVLLTSNLVQYPIVLCEVILCDFVSTFIDARKTHGVKLNWKRISFKMKQQHEANLHKLPKFLINVAPTETKKSVQKMFLIKCQQGSYNCKKLNWLNCMFFVRAFALH